MSLERSPDKNMEKAPCRNCDGKGYKVKFNEKGNPDGKEECPVCHGTGKEP